MIVNDNASENVALSAVPVSSLVKYSSVFFLTTALTPANPANVVLFRLDNGGTTEAALTALVDYYPCAQIFTVTPL